MMKKLLVGILLAALLLPWPGTYGYEGTANASSLPVTVTAVSSNLTPQATVNGTVLGSVQPGDLFYIYTSSESVNASFILFFTNVKDLAATYRSLTLAIGLFAQAADGSWIPVADYGPAGSPLFMSIGSCSTEFTVSGYHRYKVRVTHGCYYARTEHPDTQGARPEFYLTRTST